MHNLFINQHYYVRMPFKAVQYPSQRFMRYYNDLYDLEGLPRLSQKAYLKPGQYHFAALGNKVLNLYQQSDSLNELDLLVVAYWGHEFDPDSSFGAYLYDYYALHARMFDVCDQGVLSPITALCLIKNYMHFSGINKAALLCCDQTTIPVAENFIGKTPSHCSARLLIFEAKQTKETLYRIRDVKILSKHSEQFEKICLLDPILVKPDSLHYSSAEIFCQFFENNLSNKISAQYYLTVIDAESSDIGLVCFEVCPPIRGSLCNS